jgi:hypothetical protein
MGVMIITDPFRLREATSPHGKDDGVPGTVIDKLIGVGSTMSVHVMMGIWLEKLTADSIVVLVRVVGNRASTSQIKTITYFAMSILSPM